ncbi:2',3'-cyclic-nucleotide 2'-phosphodiesterase/5'-or 3'-nucleotidase, 5'-nucleotidase family [Halobacillus karajensis]|uniref:Endonuclease YhcR n=1 Tax=Halobacillus karajensis TaxID=195088 RepID=A0A024P955_9BACI|nr:bifunctional UDP-sugar hydrolase/5'-nucleotidase [Halobacillus karajensis]CDQ21281.1 Endonuclease YhcR precursor [Halobacillus karajensis]CDQ25649.1 Endonuclease YhcR precursor [Halobacillus karajensis]CDQ25920.1 Endonuclease YhcR precursor [Halobacillus karajensis]SEI10329.1 2',3'-cyclic-nucleotide 2'-phosphodiesterase/5'-or 3'-nucleotidase, 5'-nucleotidase family [Halobacillus karajensis]
MKEKLYFYYTSDLHSHFENWPQIVGYFNDQKKKHEKKGEECWLFDNGDHVDRFHPIAEGLMGKGNVELLNEAGYDIATIGNNEGITLAAEDLHSLYDQAKFRVVCANLDCRHTSSPSWLKPYHILESSYGTRIGIIGLTAPFQAFYEQLGWDVLPPFDVLDGLMEEIRKETDIIILLSHLGINEDEEIARRYHDIDIIIGGHTHHLFKNGEYIDGALLTAAGKHGTHLGEIAVEWNVDTRHLEKKEAYAIPTEHMRKDGGVTGKVQEIRSKAVHELGTPITTLKEPLHIAWFQNTPLMDRLTEQLRIWTSADIAMLNAGVLLDHLPAGNITYEDIHRICPHPMNPCRVELRGDELLEVIRAAYTKELTEIRLKGFGFRGEVIGKMVFSGVDIGIDKDDSGEEHVKNVFFNGEPIDHQRTYRFATADTFTFGRFFPEIAYSKSKKYYMPELLRDLLSEALKS